MGRKGRRDSLQRTTRWCRMRRQIVELLSAEASSVGRAGEETSCNQTCSFAAPSRAEGSRASVAPNTGTRHIYYIDPEGVARLLSGTGSGKPQSMNSNCRREKTPTRKETKTAIQSVITVEPVRKTVVVNRSTADAFRIFTEKFGSWWPLSHHIGKGGCRNGRHRTARGRAMVRTRRRWQRMQLGPGSGVESTEPAGVGVADLGRLGQDRARV